MSKKLHTTPKLDEEDSIDSMPEADVKDIVDLTSILPIDISLPEDIKGKTIYEQRILNEHITDEDKVYLISKVGKDKYQELFEACLDWNYAVTQKAINYSLENSRKETLNELIKSEAFKTIIDVHNELIKKEEEGILKFLENLISHQKYNFLIIYMYLTKKIYLDTHNVQLHSLGFTQDILNILTKNIGLSIKTLQIQD